MDTHRAILVREWDAQHTGSGCCGKIGGTHELCDADTFARAREEMDRVGAVYRALQAAFPDRLDLTVADPRNTLWLLPAVYLDARRGGQRRTEAMRSMSRATANGALILDGKVLFDGKLPPSPTEAVAAVRAELSTSTGA